MGGILGAFVATVSMVLPGSVIMLLALRSLSRFRENVIVRGLSLGIRPVGVSMLLLAAWSVAGMSLWQVSPAGWTVRSVPSLLAGFSFVALLSRRLGSMTVIVLSSVLSVALSALSCL